MIVSSTSTNSYQASLIAWSISCGLRNGRSKAVIDAMSPKCRSDQIQVVASGSSHRPGPPSRARRIMACVCRAFTSGWTGGISVRSNSSTYSACSRSAAASGTVMRLFSDPSHGTFRVAGSPGATTGPPRRRVSVFQAVAVLTGLSFCGSRMRQVEPPGSMSFQSSPRRTHLVPHTSSSSSPRAEWARLSGPVQDPSSRHIRL